MKKNRSILLFSSLLLSCITLITCKKNETVTPVYPVDCAHRLAGVFVGSDHCNSSGQTTYSCTIMAIDSMNVTFSNMGGATVTAILDCGKNTIYIPTQTSAGNFSVSGNGTYTVNRIIINWSGLSLGIPINCTSTFTR